MTLPLAEHFGYLPFDSVSLLIVAVSLLVVLHWNARQWQHCIRHTELKVQ